LPEVIPGFGGRSILQTGPGPDASLPQVLDPQGSNRLPGLEAPAQGRLHLHVVGHEPIGQANVTDAVATAVVLVLIQHVGEHEVPPELAEAVTASRPVQEHPRSGIAPARQVAVLENGLPGLGGTTGQQKSDGPDDDADDNEHIALHDNPPRAENTKLACE